MCSCARLVSMELKKTKKLFLQKNQKKKSARKSARVKQQFLYNVQRTLKMKRVA